MASKPNIWKSAATAFSRNAVTDVMKYHDFAQLDWVLSLCNNRNDLTTYLDLMNVVYRNMAKHYRCEYVYKNEIVRHLVRHFRKNDRTVVFNEFRVADSIADLAMFNGESKAFEIKTEYDSTKRLSKQLRAYSRVFDKCYVVVPEEKLSFYMPTIDDATGIILLTYGKGRVCLKTLREAEPNSHIDAHTLIRCLRTSEYEGMVEAYYGQLPEVSAADRFDACAEMMSQMPSPVLRKMFLLAMKQRKTDLGQLKSVPQPLAQLCVALNLNDKDINSLVNTLNTKIS